MKNKSNRTGEIINNPPDLKQAPAQRTGAFFLPFLFNPVTTIGTLSAF